MRSGAKRLRPRSMRLKNRLVKTRTPVEAASRAAASSAAPDERAAAQEQPRGVARAHDAGGFVNALAPWRASGRPCHHRSRIARLTPRAIGGDDESRDPPGRSQGRTDGGRCCLCDRAGALDLPNPAGNRARDPGYIGLERRFVLQVLHGVLSHDGHHRRPRFARVVQISERVPQARPGVEERGRGAARHPRVAVRRRSADAFEQAQHAAHALHAVERAHEFELRCARVHQAQVHPVPHQGCEQTFGAIHGRSDTVYGIRAHPR